jgi:hypothetical protein
MLKIYNKDFVDPDAEGGSQRKLSDSSALVGFSINLLYVLAQPTLPVNKE